ncbi:MAG: hypothetical protein AAB693_01640 [Patescibacteria group bacterium]
MGFFNFQKKDELVLLIDIGSSSVGGALVLLSKSGIPKIIFCIREPIKIKFSDFENKLNINHVISPSMKSIKIIIDKICKAGLGVPKRFFCVLSSPWHISEIRSIQFKKSEPFIFTEKLANDLIKKELLVFLKEIQGPSPASSAGKLMPQGIKPIEFKNIQTKLNGYVTAQPINQKAKELEMTIFISFTPEIILKNIEEIISNHFHFESFSGVKPGLNFLSFNTTSFVVIRDLFIEQKDFLLIDIGGEITNITTIKKDIPNDIISFPFGYNFFISGISSSLSCSFDEAKSFLFLYKEGHASIEVVKKLEPIINKLKTEWLKNFQNSLASISNNIFIPETIFLTIDQDLADFFSKIIKTEEFNQYSFTKSKFQVIPMDFNFFNNNVNFQESKTNTLNPVRNFDPNGVNATGYIFMGIEAIYINTFFR